MLVDMLFVSMLGAVAASGLAGAFLTLSPLTERRKADVVCFVSIILFLVDGHNVKDELAVHLEESVRM